MEPCGARNRSDGYFTDGCVAARIADDRLDRPGAPGPSGASRLAEARSPERSAGDACSSNAGERPQGSGCPCRGIAEQSASVGMVQRPRSDPEACDRWTAGPLVAGSATNSRCAADREWHSSPPASGSCAVVNRARLAGIGGASRAHSASLRSLGNPPPFRPIGLAVRPIPAPTTAPKPPKTASPLETACGLPAPAALVCEVSEVMTIGRQGSCEWEDAES